jgi:hypothetical protein
MLKKFSLIAIMFTLLATSAFSETCSVLPEDALTLDSLNSASEIVDLKELVGAANVLNDSTNLSESLVKNSEDLLALSKSLRAANSNVNSDYIKSMLQLSQDILSMADKIGEMSDRILEMADKIDDMADKIVETQEIQNENVALIQANILEAQDILNKLLEK